MSGLAVSQSVNDLGRDIAVSRQVANSENPPETMTYTHVLTKSECHVLLVVRPGAPSSVPAPSI